MVIDISHELRRESQGNRGRKREATHSVANHQRILDNRERYSAHLFRVLGPEKLLWNMAPSVSDTIRRDAPVRKRIETTYNSHMVRGFTFSV